MTDYREQIIKALQFPVKWHHKGEEDEEILDRFMDQDSAEMVYDEHLAPIVQAVHDRAILDNGDAFLGMATTMQLIDELAARVDVAHANGDKWPKSNDLNGPGSGVTTMKLVNELKYRAHAADNSNYEWPHKRTVDGGFSVKIDV